MPMTSPSPDPVSPVQFRIDTHVHTSEASGCGREAARVIVNLYKKAGFDAIVITDHYNTWNFEGYEVETWPEVVDKFLSGYRAAREEGERVGLLVLPGMEITFDAQYYSDFLVYGLEPEYLYQFPELQKLGLRLFRELVAPLGAYINQAHPFRDGCVAADPNLIDGVEVYNGGNDARENRLALAYAHANGLPELSGSDFHHRISLGRGGLILPDRVSDSSDFVEMLQANPKLPRIETR